MTEWLSTERAANAIGVTTRTLYGYIDEGRLPAYRFGRVIRLRPADVETFIASSRINPGELAHLAHTHYDAPARNRTHAS